MSKKQGHTGLYMTSTEWKLHGMNGGVGYKAPVAPCRVAGAVWEGCHWPRVLVRAAQPNGRGECHPKLSEQRRPSAAALLCLAVVCR